MAKILLVEDDNNLREIYEARLQAEGYEIAGASNGEEALVVAKKELPDLVIADVMMPRISGFEMLDILRNTQGLEHVKVVMLTALGQAEDKTRADQLGADRYLVKSQVTLEDIVKAASDLLGGGGGSAAPAAGAQSQPNTGQAATPQPKASTGNAPQQSAPAQANQAAQPAPQAAPQQQTPAPPPAPPPSTPIAVATPPPEPAQPQTQSQPVQTDATTPQTAQQAPQDNTTQLNNAVKDLMKGTTKTEDSTQSEQTQPKQEPAAAPANTPTGPANSQPAPAPDQTNNDSVTLSGKKTIKPLGPNAETKPHINDLLAKEEANSGNQPGKAPAPAQPQMPTSPHPGGHVFSPTAQPPQQNPPENPNDPNKIAL